MEEFPANNGASKPKKQEERQRVEKVVSGEVVRRKKSLGRRIFETFFGSADARGVAQYLAQDVVVPMTKDLITDVVTQGIERTLYGETRGRGSSSRSRSASPYVPYNRYTQGSSISTRREEPRREISSRGRARHEFDELEFDNRFEAEEVLDRMHGQIKRYGNATVADFYEACGISAQFVDENHGWDDLRDAGVTRLRGGKYVISFPETLDIR